jgi:DNA-binding NarL/FixJ family response regulator
MQEFTSTHPRPDIILMDVQVREHAYDHLTHLLTMSMQMPIRDGYSATHAIRTEAPWKDIPEVRSVPIVAMTASAIQGDKEKCTLAGMDVSLQLGADPFYHDTTILRMTGLSGEARERQALRKG